MSPAPHLLAIDVGNTNTVIGLFEGKRLVADWRIASDPHRTSDELAATLLTLFAHRDEPTEVSAAIVSTVVPPLTEILLRLVERYFDVPCMVVGPGIKTGMPILCDNPREVGADRIVNAVAAYDRYPGGLIIVDFGTATTIDVVDPTGAYLGGAICPGIGISSDALFRRASRLPRVEFARPKSVIGKNTVASMQSGLIYGYVGLVDGLVVRMKREVDFPTKVVATGGLAPIIAHESETIETVDSDLTLAGLMLLYERNVRPQESRKECP